MSRVRALACCVAALLAAPATRADEHGKRVCVDAATNGQHLLGEGKLRQARDAFTVCVDPACPSVVRQSCVDWLADTNKRIPRVIVRVVDASEHEVPGARVRVDGVGEPSAPGATIALEPGEHSVEAVAADQTQRETFRLTEREARTLVIRLRTGGPEPGGGAASHGGESGPAPTRSPIPTAAWVLGGVAVLGLGSFTYFGLSARGDVDRLRSTCAPHCPGDQLDAAKRQALAADVSLGVGVAAALAATILVLVGPPTGTVAASVAFARDGFATGLAF